MSDRFPRWPLALSLVALAIPLLDFTLIGLFRWNYMLTPYRMALALAVSVVLGEFLRDAATPSAWRPAPSWGYWGRMTLILGAILLGAIVVGYGLLLLAGVRPLHETLMLEEIPEALYRMCVDAPLVEEVIYRQAVCGAVLSLAGPRWAIFASGILFAELHWVYGNPSPENQLGGFVLAWMYLRSGTLLVPVLFHLVGNFAALWLQVLAYYTIGPARTVLF